MKFKINNFIDKIFIINLKERTDRKEKISQELKKQNIEIYEFFEAITCSDEDVKNWNKNYIPNYNKTYGINNEDNYRRSCLGCLKSHVEVMKIALQRGYNKILILEDDCKFVKNYGYISKSLQNFNKEINLLYLSGAYNGEKKKINNNIYKITNTLQTCSYIVGKNVMNYIVNNIEGYEKEIDVFYSDVVQTNFDCYAMIPKVIRQESGYSNILNKDVKYY